MTKIKALGIGLLAALSVCAISVMSATAETGGHFVSEVAHTNLVGTESGSHILHFKEEGAAAEKQIGCDKDSYTGTASSTTVSEITITPNWSECHTTEPNAAKFDIHENGCAFVFTVGKKVHNTADVECPKGKAIEITHPNCTITIPAQTVNGVTYKTTEESGKHAITLESTVENIASEYHNGICIFLGTPHESAMFGSVTVVGQNTAGEPVGITATG